MEKKKALVVTDPGLIKFGVAKMVTDVLDEAGIAYEIFSDVKPNPTVTNVTNGIEAFRKAEADVIVAIGGGSSIDTAKGIGIVISNPDFADIVSLEVAHLQSTRVCLLSHSRQQPVLLPRPLSTM